MRACPQWILWRLVERVGQKPLKLPVSPHTGKVCDAHNAQEWVTYEIALQCVEPLGATGVAFVFTTAAGYWFLDIDDALSLEGQWSPLAVELCGALAGAGVEVSQSGRGLHIFGRGTVPPHSCKNTGLHIELYTEGRFCAVTGDRASGDVSLDCTATIAGVVARYFPFDPTAGVAGPVGSEQWVDVADPEWAGPADDDELLTRMFAAKASVGQVLAGKASPEQLWNADCEALANNFPDSGGREWDASSADAALAAHLAFWTGKNTERMRRMMWKSALVREKWEKHRSYLWRTIKNACDRQTSVYRERRPSGALLPAGLAGALSAAPVVASGLEPEMRAGFQFLAVNQQVEYFEQCVYIADMHRMHTPRGLLKPEQFNAVYGGFDFAMDSGNEKTSKNPFEVFTQSRGVRFPKVDSSCFRPEMGSRNLIIEDGRMLYNGYRPVETRRVAGDASPFINHLKGMLPIERDLVILLSWMAAVVQRPGVKLQWWPVIQGVEGNGKSMIGRVLEYAVGRCYTHMPKAKELAESGTTFSAWLRDKLLLVIEELKVGDKTELLEALKDMVTNDRIELQGKGVDQVMGDNRANGIAFTNHKDAMTGGAGAVDRRRYAIFYCGQQTAVDIEAQGWGGDYFPNLYNWLRADGYAIVNNYLREFQIPDWMEAVLMTRAPSTSSSELVALASLGSVEQEIIELMESGQPGFAGGWVNSLALDRFLKESRYDRRVPPRKRREMLKVLGYDWHPNLPEGRVNNPLPGDAGKPRLFIKTNHPDIRISQPARVVDAYLKAQGIGSLIFPNKDAQL